MSNEYYVEQLIEEHNEFLPLNPEDFELIPHTLGKTILAISNRATIIADCAEDEILDCGNDGILARKSSEKAMGWIESLEGYPVADESDFSEREWTAEREAWDGYGRDDMRREMVKYLEKRLQWLDRERPMSDKCEQDIIDALTDDQVDALYYARVQEVCGGESVTWEEDYDGSHGVFNIEGAVWGAMSYEQRKSNTWNPKAWDGLVPALDGTGKVEYTAGDITAWEPIVEVKPKCLRCGETCNYTTPGTWTHGLWYSDCGIPVCDVALMFPPTTLARLAYDALGGDKDALAVVQDAVEESGDHKLAQEVKGDGWGTTHAAQVIRHALKEIASGARPMLNK